MWRLIQLSLVMGFLSSGLKADSCGCPDHTYGSESSASAAGTALLGTSTSGIAAQNTANTLNPFIIPIESTGGKVDFSSSD